MREFYRLLEGVVIEMQTVSTPDCRSGRTSTTTSGRMAL
jgi:hypothetical protein